MKRRVKKVLTFLCLITSLSCLSVIPVMADTIENDLETDMDFAEDTTYSVLRGNNLNYGTTTIKKLASNKVIISGITQCHHSCSKVYLSVYLERKVNGTYSTYKGWDFTKVNASNLTKDITVIVPSGYYYRVRGYHAAKDGSKESVITLTKGILVK